MRAASQPDRGHHVGIRLALELGGDFLERRPIFLVSTAWSQVMQPALLPPAAAPSCAALSPPRQPYRRRYRDHASFMSTPD